MGTCWLSAIHCRRVQRVQLQPCRSLLGHKPPCHILGCCAKELLPSLKETASCCAVLKQIPSWSLTPSLFSNTDRVGKTNPACLWSSLRAITASATEKFVCSTYDSTCVADLCTRSELLDSTLPAPLMSTSPSGLDQAEAARSSHPESVEALDAAPILPGCLPRLSALSFLMMHTSRYTLQHLACSSPSAIA